MNVGYNMFEVLKYLRRLVWKWVGGRNRLTWTAWYQAGDIDDISYIDDFGEFGDIGDFGDFEYIADIGHISDFADICNFGSNEPIRTNL